MASEVAVLECPRYRNKSNMTRSKRGRAVRFVSATAVWIQSALMSVRSGRTPSVKVSSFRFLIPSYMVRRFDFHYDFSVHVLRGDSPIRHSPQPCQPSGRERRSYLCDCFSSIASPPNNVGGKEVKLIGNKTALAPLKLNTLTLRLSVCIVRPTPSRTPLPSHVYSQSSRSPYIRECPSIF